MEKFNLFPTLFTDSLAGPLVHPKGLAGFRAVRSNRNVQAVTCYLENGRIYCKTLQWNAQLDHHFVHTGKDSHHLQQQQGTHPWSTVERRLKLDVSSAKKNTDVRTCFVYDPNVFLVKPQFTFGYQKVKPDTFHVYQTSTVPLALYVAAGPTRFRREREFSAAEQFKFKLCMLPPGGTYYVPAGVEYVMVAQHKTLFSVHVMREVPSFAVPYSESSALSYLDKVPMTPALDRAQMEETMREFLVPVQPPPPPLEQQQQERDEPIPETHSYCYVLTPVHLSSGESATWARTLLAHRYPEEPPVPPDFKPLGVEEGEEAMDLTTVTDLDRILTEDVARERIEAFMMSFEL